MARNLNIWERRNRIHVSQQNEEEELNNIKVNLIYISMPTCTCAQPKNIPSCTHNYELKPKLNDRVGSASACILQFRNNTLT